MMTTETNRYQQGKIYKIYRDDCPEIYIGSTAASTLACRLSQHVSHTRCGNNTSVSRYLVDRPGYYITLLETYPCSTRDELRAREQYHIDASENTINRQKAYTGLTEQEYNLQYHKQYYAKNKDYVLECNRRYVASNPARKKAMDKAYYEKNKEGILLRIREKVTCDCGFVGTKINLARHMKTQKHIQLMAAQASPLQ